MKKVQEILHDTGFEATIPQITKKIILLKSQYSAEKRKVEASGRKSGSGTETQYVPKWQFYRSLGFLHDNFKPRETESNLDVSREPCVSNNNTRNKVMTSTSAERMTNSMETMIKNFGAPAMNNRLNKKCKNPRMSCLER